MVAEPYKYWAFISYSHRDQACADWLHRALETYRVPRRLAGRDSPVGAIPRRLFPIFRDTEELSSSPNLSAVIDQALQQSRYLIVIASPYAAVSRWVDQEILRFRALGRGDRIFCLIVDGEPHADRLPDKGLLECFPPALREAGAAEPVGADLRPGKERKAAARLRLIAGLLGVGLDELRRRERRRQIVRSVSWAAASIFGLLVLTGLWQDQQSRRREALAQQALHTRVQVLYENGRKELQSRNEARAAVYLDEAYRLGLDTPALRFMLGRAMRIVDAEKLAFATGTALREIAFSPDAQRIFTLNADHRVQIWETSSGRLLGVFEVPADSGGFRFSVDGRQLLYPVDEVAAHRHRLIVADAGSGQQLAELVEADTVFPAHTRFDASGRRVAFVQPDQSVGVYDLDSTRVALKIPGHYVLAGYDRGGHWLVTGDAQGAVAIWNAQSGRLLRRFESLGSAIVYTDSSADGALLAAGASEGAFRVWETASGRMRIRAAHSSRYIGHVFSADGARLLTSSTDSARVWDTHSGALLHSLKFTDNEERIHISEDGRWLVNTGAARLGVVDIRSGAEIFSLDGHFDGVAEVCFSKDNRLLVTAGNDGVVAVWALPHFPLAEFQHGIGHEDAADPLSPVLSAVGIFSPSGRYLLTAGSAGQAVLRDAHSLAVLHELEAGASTVTAAAFSNDETELALGSVGDISLWNVDAGQRIGGLGGFDRRVTLLRFDADGRRLAASIRGGFTKVWDLPSGALRASFERDYSPAMAFSPDRRHFGIGIDGAVKLWNLDQNAFEWSVPIANTESHEEVAALAFSRDGRDLLAASSRGGLYLLNGYNGSILNRQRDETSVDVETAELSPDENSALIADDNRCALRWRFTGSQLQHLCDHGSAVISARFSADGALLVTGSMDGTAKIWDAASDSLLDTLALHGGALSFYEAGFNPPGTRVLTASRDGTASLWDVTPERRTPAAISAVLRCRVPWKLEGEALLAARPDLASCKAP